MAAIILSCYSLAVKFFHSRNRTIYGGRENSKREANTALKRRGIIPAFSDIRPVVEVSHWWSDNMETSHFTPALGEIKKLCSDDNLDLWYLSYPTKRDDVTGEEPTSSAKVFCHKQVALGSSEERTLVYRAVKDIERRFEKIFFNQLNNKSHWTTFFQALQFELSQPGDDGGRRT